LWIATSSIGVYKTYKSQILETITSENGLPTNGAMCIYQDYEKNYWFGTTNGLYKLSGFDKYTFNWKGKPIENVSSLEKDEFGRMWLFANTSASILSGSKITPILLEGSPVFEGGIKMALFQGNILWIGNHNGLFSMPINNSMPDLKKLKLKANFIKAGITRLRMIHNDSDGKIWLGSDQGLFVFSKNKFLPCELKITNASKIQPSAIVKDKYGYYWLGDYSFGLYRMKLVSEENEKFVFDSIKVYKSLKPDSAFVNAWIQDLITDNEGNIWQASLYSGVYKLRIDKHGVTGAKQYSVKNGLSGNLVSSVFEDKFKRIWFATQLGADCLYKNAKGEERFLHFNKKDGFGDQVLSILPDSAVTYFTFNEGLFALENKSLTNTLHTTPKIYITNITVNGEAESAVGTSQTPVKYRHNKNYFEFEFASVSFRHETGTTYRYMLRGQDKNWQKFTDRRFTSYNALRPGNYAFMVEAKSADGVMSKSPAIFYFKILPPLYLKWWFISLVILVVIALVYALYFYRIKQLLKMERMRTQIASDLHDDIGSTLSSISILSEILEGQIDSNPRSTEMISKIGHNAKTMLESMDDIIWSVNPKNDRFENLGLRIREYAIPLFETLGISFAIHIPEGLDGLTVPMNIRRSVYLIAKEAINNLAKYSGCNHAEIAFRIKDNVLEMEISDNGKGFDPQTPTSRNGLRNMRRRAEQINSEIQIESVINKGTVIKLRVKII
jgi:hypothetical protein